MKMDFEQFIFMHLGNFLELQLVMFVVGTAEALMGHGFYMDTYYQLPEDKKKQMYLNAESDLTISDFKQVEKNFKVISAKNSQLEEKFNDLLQYLRTNSIEVPNFQK